MRLSYDPKYNMAYIKLRDKAEQVETIRVSDELNVDVAPDGTVYGIELLNANDQLSGDRLGSFVVVNEASGESAEVKLAI